MSDLILPGMPGFYETLSQPPPEPNGDCAFVVRPGSGGVPSVCPLDKLDEYLLSGEYDERLIEIEKEEESVEINQGLVSDILYLPKAVRYD